MQTKSTIFKKLLPFVTSKLNDGYTYKGVVKYLKENHSFDITLGTFRNYLYRYKVKDSEDISLSDTHLLLNNEDVVEGVDVVEPVIDSAVEDAQPSSSILSRQKHNFVSLSRLNDEANRFLDAAEEKR